MSVNAIVAPILNPILGAILGGGGGGPSPPAIQDVFVIDLWTGDAAASRNIITGFDMTVEKGMVWMKARTPFGTRHLLGDTVRIGGSFIPLIATDENTAGGVLESSTRLRSFNSDGFQIGNSNELNRNLGTFVAWSFIAVPKFFDVVTYIGDGSANRQIPHNLGIDAGLVLIKNLSRTRDWAIQHISRGGTKILAINTAVAEITGTTYWDDTDADASNVTVGSNIATNNDTEEFLMYVFAHDPSPDGVIQCGEYLGTGADLNVVLGWKPQYIMIKNATANGDWSLQDTTRGIVGDDRRLQANLNNVESGGADVLQLNVDGFTVDATAGSNYNTNGQTYIFMAIREA